TRGTARSSSAEAGSRFACVRIRRAPASSERLEPNVNINFAAAALSERGRKLLRQVWGAALDLGGRAYDVTHAASEMTDRRAVLNAQAVDGTWAAATWLRDEYGVRSLAQP